jgi:hypothetical protein
MERENSRSRAKLKAAEIVDADVQEVEGVEARCSAPRAA